MLTKLIITVLFFTLNLITFSKMTEYQDFSSERSTWFFKIDKEGKNTIFSDFYPPFDPSVKVENFSPIMEYNLDSNYYFNNQNNLMAELEDLKKIYAPYFSYSLEKDRLNIEFVRYDKEIIGNLGKRNTKLEYTKRVWNLSLDIKNSVGEIEYSQYEKFIGGRNKKFIEPTKILVRKRSTITLSNKDFEKSGDKLYISASKIMKYFDIKTIIQEGYLALQFDNIPRITTQTSNPPSAKNIWLSGGVERTDKNYTWADYMNDIIEGRRKSGWFWKGIYISEKDSFRDNDGKSIEPDINRIVPLAIYIPSNYSPKDSRLAFILHGGTGNENASAYRLAQRDIYLEKYAEKYNYILAFPNGWTQNPLWMHRQALVSFEKSYDLVMENFPVSEDRVFLMGNSLGGRGTFDVAMRKPDMFQAIVSTAPAWGVKTHSQWVQNRYSVKDIESVPTLIGVGTADSTFSFRVEVGNKVDKGWITRDIEPYLKNATYITVEEGNHTYNWGSILDIIFDFFESNLENKSNPTSKISSVTLNGKEINGTTMIELGDFEKTFGDRFKVYKVYSYDKKIENAVEYYTIISKNQTLNFKVGDRKYRKNIERYKEDIGKRDKDIELLDNAPTFSQAPTLIDGKVYIPVKEILEVMR